MPSIDWDDLTPNNKRVSDTNPYFRRDTVGAKVRYVVSDYSRTDVCVTRLLRFQLLNYLFPKSSKESGWYSLACTLNS